MGSGALWSLPCCWERGGIEGFLPLDSCFAGMRWHSTAWHSTLAVLTLLFPFAPRVIYPLSDSPAVKMSQSSPADEGTTFEHLWSTL